MSFLSGSDDVDVKNISSPEQKQMYELIFPIMKMIAQSAGSQSKPANYPSARANYNVPTPGAYQAPPQSPVNLSSNNAILQLLQRASQNRR